MILTRTATLIKYIWAEQIRSVGLCRLGWLMHSPNKDSCTKFSIYQKKNKDQEMGFKN